LAAALDRTLLRLRHSQMSEAELVKTGQTARMAALQIWNA
jgi:hypothetical protein